MSDKENEFEDLDNLDNSNTVSEDEFSEYEEAMEELEEESVDELEEVESEEGDIVEFEEDEEDEEEPVKKSGSKARLAILGIVGVIGVAGVVTLVGTNLGLFGSSQKTVQYRPSQEEAPKEKVEDVKDLSPISFDEEISVSETDPSSENKGLKVKLSEKEGLAIDPIVSVDVDKEAAKAPAKEPVKEEAQKQVVENEELTFSSSKVASSEAVTHQVTSEELAKISARLEVVEKISENLSMENQKESDRFDIVIAKLNRLTDISREAKEAKVVEVEKQVPRLSVSEKAALTSGRSRLPGYSVIATSRDGTMSIIRSLKYGKERVSVFFKGEKIIVAGKGVMTISDIKDSGHLALVGSKYYMDDTYVPFVEPKKSKPVAKKSKPKKAKPVNSKHDKKETVVVNTVEKPAKFKEVKFREVAKGWKMNGVYTDSFLIESPTGDWSTRVVGDKIPGLGIVQGLDVDGNLIVGEHLIKLVKLPE